MKRARVAKGFMLLALAVLISSPFVFAGFGDWLKSFTGEAVENTTDVSITLGNNAPKIYWVQPTTGQIPIENYGYDYYITFNATDPDGAANLNTSTASIRLNNSGTFRDNASCNPGAVMGSNSSNQQFNCTIHLEYWDVGAVWTINATIFDINGANSTNFSTSFTHDLLHAVVINPTAQTWAGITTSDKNTTADEGYMNITNTGNRDGLDINVTAKDLRGIQFLSEFIFAENFSIGHEAGAEAGCNGTQMINDSTVQISGSSVPRGPVPTGREQIFFCINALDATLPSQEYNSTAYGPWNVTTST